METPKKDKSFGCIAFCPQDGGRFLLVQHRANDGSGGHWSFPKGHANEFEHKTDAALRELVEETGLKPDEFSDDMIFTDEFSYDHIDGHTVEKTVTYFVAMFYEVRAPDINGAEENEVFQAAWVSHDEALTNLPKSSADMLKEAKLELSLNGLL